MNMGSKTKQLVKVLDQIISLLESDEEDHWKMWVSESKRRLLNSDYSGIEHLLSAYGGMGSFNDLVICQSSEDGKLTWKEGYKKKNNTLSKLRSKAWELATYIKRNQEIKDTEQ
jgi:hypothetical protein